MDSDLMKLHLESTQFGDIIPCMRWQHTITSDWKLLENVPNLLGVCQKTGIIVNTRGIRGQEGRFFSDDYELHTESDECEEVYVTQSGVEAQSLQTIEMLKSAKVIGSKGKLLEIGAAKGNFLKRFLAEFSQWQVSAVEPSRHAETFLKQHVQAENLHVGTLESFDCPADNFDIIVSNFVIAHLADPFKFVEKISQAIAHGGVVLIGTPNFINNPLDQFTADHLSRFTPNSLKLLFSRYGFEQVEHWADERVPMWSLFRKTGVKPAVSVQDVAAEGVELIASHTRFAAQLFETAQSLVDKANGKKIAVYGLSSAALIAGLYTDLKIEKISCFFDDNFFFHGTTRCGVKILPLADILESNEKFVFLSSNPVYFSQMKSKVVQIAGDDCCVVHP